MRFPSLLAAYSVLGHLFVTGSLALRVQQEKNDKGLRFMWIQKSGGTTFGDMVMTHFCGAVKNKCSGTQHIDWSQATDNGTFGGQVVTLLRDPVERTLSEFFWLRTVDGFLSASQSHWDFRNDTWLQIVQHEPDTEKALDVYLHGYPKNPSRNRQMLYVLGFRKGIWGPIGYATPNPGAVYNWDEKPAFLLKQAYRHLDNLTAFGITECFKSSLSAIGRQLGWNASHVLEVAAKTYKRKYQKSRLAVSPLDKYEEDPATRSVKALLSRGQPHNDAPWRTLLPKAIIADIEKINKLDMKLYKYARQSFVQRFGEECRQ